MLSSGVRGSITAWPSSACGYERPERPWNDDVSFGGLGGLEPSKTSSVFSSIAEGSCWPKVVVVSEIEERRGVCSKTENCMSDASNGAEVGVRLLS